VVERVDQTSCTILTQCAQVFYELLIMMTQVLGLVRLRDVMRNCNNITHSLIVRESENVLVVTVMMRGSNGALVMASMMQQSNMMQQTRLVFRSGSTPR
jgi:hypothetical protein